MIQGELLKYTRSIAKRYKENCCLIQGQLLYDTIRIVI